MGNGFQLVRLEEAGAVGFKREMQKAFQYGYEVEFGPCAEVILPEEDIDRSLNAPGAVAYVAMVEGVPSGGAVVKIDPEGRRNHLELLFVKVGTQSRGGGAGDLARDRGTSSRHGGVGDLHSLLREAESPFLHQLLRFSCRGVLQSAPPRTTGTFRYAGRRILLPF